MSPVRIALVDEDDKTTDLVVAALWDFEPAVTVSDVTALSDARDGFAAVLFDADRFGDEGKDALVAHTRVSRTPVAVFTASPSVDAALDYLRLGARGFLSKHSSTMQLASNLAHLLDGGWTIDPTVGGELAHAVALRPALAWSGMSDGLTPREGEVLDLLRRGLSNRQIADLLLVGMQTVKSHTHRIYGKLGIEGRVGLDNT